MKERFNLEASLRRSFKNIQRDISLALKKNDGTRVRLIGMTINEIADLVSLIKKGYEERTEGMPKDLQIGINRAILKKIRVALEG